MDPTDAEESVLGGTVMVAHMPNLNQITHVLSNGQITTDLAIEVIYL